MAQHCILARPPSCTGLLQKQHRQIETVGLDEKSLCIDTYSEHDEPSLAVQRQPVAMPGTSFIALVGQAPSQSIHTLAGLTPHLLCESIFQPVQDGGKDVFAVVGLGPSTGRTLPVLLFGEGRAVRGTLHLSPAQEIPE